jgi:speckle-type POZ protein
VEEWRISYHQKGNYLHIMLQLPSKSRSVNAIFEVMFIDKDGQRNFINEERTSRSPMSFCASCISVHLHSASGTNLFKKYLEDGQIKFLCTIRVFHGDSSITVPPSNIVRHLGTLLDTADGKDVSFTIDGETFHAHRAVLAARSPVFKAELHGAMAEATMRLS